MMTVVGKAAVAMPVSSSACIAMFGVGSGVRAVLDLEGPGEAEGESVDTAGLFRAGTSSGCC